MANTEGNIYEARWKKQGAGFVAWLKKLPAVKVAGAKEDELKEKLWEIVLENFGDGDACIELVPPLPVLKGSALYFDPPLFAFSWNEGFRTVGDPAELYRKGKCPFCRAGLGGRNAVERVIDGYLKGDFGGLWGALPSVEIVSDDFLEFLRPHLGSSIKAIRCQTTKKTRKKMWEIELKGRVPLVCHRMNSYAKGIRCPRCKTACFGGFVYKPIREALLHAVERPIAARVKKAAFVAISGAHSRIIVNEKIAKRIRESTLKGVLLDRVALLRSDEIGLFDIRTLTKADV